MRWTARFCVVTVAAVLGLLCAVEASATAAPAPPNPAPTPAHPLQGLRKLTVATIPPVPGMKFAVDGAVFVADARGVASTYVTKAQREAVRADRGAHLTILTPQLEPEPGVRARFTGWSGPGQYRRGPVPEEYQRATFDIDYLTSFGFSTVGGVTVAPRTLRSMVLVSSLGDRINAVPSQPQWLQGTRTATGAHGLQSRAVSYRVQSVTTSGVNTVNRGQQQFFPSRQRQVDIQLLFFDVTFSARDALFGSATGTSIVLRYPDGHERTYALGSDHAVRVRHLPRGKYHVTVRGAGPQLAQKLTVSRDQRADLDTVTWIDVALGGVVLLLLGIGLFVLRRVFRRRGARTNVDLVEAERAEKDPELIGSR